MRVEAEAADTSMFSTMDSTGPEAVPGTTRITVLEGPSGAAMSDPDVSVILVEPEEEAGERQEESQERRDASLLSVSMACRDTSHAGREHSSMDQTRQNVSTSMGINASAISLISQTSILDLTNEEEDEDEFTDDDFEEDNLMFHDLMEANPSALITDADTEKDRDDAKHQTSRKTRGVSSKKAIFSKKIEYPNDDEVERMAFERASNGSSILGQFSLHPDEFFDTLCVTDSCPPSESCKRHSSSLSACSPSACPPRGNVCGYGMGMSSTASTASQNGKTYADAGSTANSSSTDLSLRKMQFGIGTDVWNLLGCADPPDTDEMESIWNLNTTYSKALPRHSMLFRKQRLRQLHHEARLRQQLKQQRKHKQQQQKDKSKSRQSSSEASSSAYQPTFAMRASLKDRMQRIHRLRQERWSGATRHGVTLSQQGGRTPFAPHLQQRTISMDHDDPAHVMMIGGGRRSTLTVNTIGAAGGRSRFDAEGRPETQETPRPVSPDPVDGYDSDPEFGVVDITDSTILVDSSLLADEEVVDLLPTTENASGEAADTIQEEEMDADAPLHGNMCTSQTATTNNDLVIQHCPTSDSLVDAASDDEDEDSSKGYASPGQAYDTEDESNDENSDQDHIVYQTVQQTLNSTWTLTWHPNPRNAKDFSIPSHKPICINIWMERGTVITNSGVVVEPTFMWRDAYQPGLGQHQLNASTQKPWSMRLLNTCRISPCGERRVVLNKSIYPLARQNHCLLLKTCEGQEFLLEASSVAQVEMICERWKLAVARFASLAVTEDIDAIAHEFFHPTLSSQTLTLAPHPVTRSTSNPKNRSGLATRA